MLRVNLCRHLYHNRLNKELQYLAWMLKLYSTDKRYLASKHRQNQHCHNSLFSINFVQLYHHIKNPDRHHHLNLLPILQNLNRNYSDPFEMDAQAITRRKYSLAKQPCLQQLLYKSNPSNLAHCEI